MINRFKIFVEKFTADGRSVLIMQYDVFDVIFNILSLSCKFQNRLKNNK